MAALTLTFADATVSEAAIFGNTKTPDYYESNTREHFKHQRWKEGKILLDEAWHDYGTMSVMNELMGWYYYHFKKYDKARFYLVRALRDDNTNTHARELLALLEEATYNYSSAICYINELLEANPYSRGWWRRKINIYRKQGNNEEADRLLHRLQVIYPNDSIVKKDVAYLNEQALAKHKRNGDYNGQIASLQNLVKAYPNNAEYYMQLSNALLQAGRTAEATEIAIKGAKYTHSVALMRKAAGIMSEQGRYVEAINYLKECQRTYSAAALTADINGLEKSAAESAQLNDPYTSMARVYAKQHDGEALTYLLNTAIARGYYDDALEYIRDAKKGKGETEELLYKEFIVQRRLGNATAALSLLTRLYAKNPRNEEVAEYLSEMRYESATEQMNYGQYAEAIPDLQFAMENATDGELKKGAMLRLFNCYLETKRYDEAMEQLEKMRNGFGYENYTYQKAAVLKAQGRIDAALQLLAAEYDATDDPQKAKYIAYQYEEYALPYIKGMVEAGMIRQADKAVKRALLVSPKSNDLLHLAITTSDILGNGKDYEEMVMAGRREYPEDPFFIVKEAGILNSQKKYQEAVDLLRPNLDTYVGDSTLVAAFAESSMLLAEDQARSKAYSSAIATLDTALVYRANDHELLYHKGLYFESIHQYDSAYIYQKYYKPTLMDYREHSRHLEELQGMLFNNEVTLMYQQARPGDQDVISANAYATYTRKNTYNDYTFTMGYAGRDGVSSENQGKEMETGGTGVQLGVDWKHRFKDSPWAFGIGAAWSSKYFPQITVKGHIEREFAHDWLLNLHASYRRLHTYSRNYKWIKNPEKELNNPLSPDSVYVSTHWNHNYKSLIQVGLTAEKTIDKFLAQGTLDLSLMNSKIYFNGQLKGQFFPIEGSRTHVFATGGVGNAPQTELLDNSMPAGFDKLNTFVGAGLMWFFNKHIAASVSGTWYTMYRSQIIQTGVWDAYASSVTSSLSTDYKNMFYIQGQLYITF